mgnify:CR=1 FL=1
MPSSPEALYEVLSSRGMGFDNEVVLYDETDNRHATLAFMVLTAYGYRRVSLLDGGRLYWYVLGRPVCTCNGHFHRPISIGIGKSMISAKELSRYFVTFDELLSAVNDGRIGKDILLIDARSREEYVGAIEIWGHIPGAINIPWNLLLDVRTNRFKSSSELRELFNYYGVSPGDDIVIYCRSGGRSALMWFALTQILGYSRVRVYLGSWLEWFSRGAPIKVGELP